MHRRLNDPVSKYIPSFNREWKVVTVVDADGEWDPKDPPEKWEAPIEYTSFMSGKTETITYKTAPARKTMTIKHLMSESAGISYDMFADMGLQPECAVVQALRYKSGGGHYSSNAIIGQVR